MQVGGLALVEKITTVPVQQIPRNTFFSSPKLRAMWTYQAAFSLESHNFIWNQEILMSP